MTRYVYFVVAALSVPLALSCKQASQRSSSPALAEVCSAVAAGYVVPGGPPEGEVGKQAKLFRKLAEPIERRRMNAARKLLGHSECRVPAINEAAIRASGLSGDPRVVADLAEIVTQHGFVTDPCESDDDGEHDDDDGEGDDDDFADDRDDADDDGSSFVVGTIRYPLTTRIAAAAALGRILERGRVLLAEEDDDGNNGHGNDDDGHDESNPGNIRGNDDDDDGENDQDDGNNGHGNDEDGHDESNPGNGHDGDDDSAFTLTESLRASAAQALQLGSCANEDTRLRVAAIEALGIARNPATTGFLDVVFEGDTGAPDASRGLLLQAVAGRSLTNITHNNHLEESDVDEKLRELLLNLQQQQGAQP